MQLDEWTKKYLGEELKGRCNYLKNVLPSVSGDTVAHVAIAMLNAEGNIFFFRVDDGCDETAERETLRPLMDSAIAGRLQIGTHDDVFRYEYKKYRYLDVMEIKKELLPKNERGVNIQGSKYRVFVVISGIGSGYDGFDRRVRFLLRHYLEVIEGNIAEHYLV
jgi:hypothetical protein